jgi:hypothetical protein
MHILAQGPLADLALWQFRFHPVPDTSRGVPLFTWRFTVSL